MPSSPGTAPFPVAAVKQWLERGAPTATEPPALVRRAAYQLVSVGNPARGFAFATFQSPSVPMAPVVVAARHLHDRLALDWLDHERAEVALWLTYPAGEVGAVQVAGSAEGAAYDRFQPVAADSPYGWTDPSPPHHRLPEVVHDNWAGSGEVLCGATVLDPVPCGRVGPR
jgi:hypothetical protein